MIKYDKGVAMNKLRKDKTGLILAGLILGVIFGLLMKAIPDGVIRNQIISDGILTFLGTGFINLIKMVVVPLVFSSLVCGMTSFGDMKTLGRVGSKTILFYLCTTALAVTAALVLGVLLNPGSGLDMSYLVKGEYSIPESKPIVDVFLDMIPTNPIQSMAEGNLLQIIIVAVIFGASLNLLRERGKPLVNLFEIANECIMKIVTMIMTLAPIGVFALIAKTVFSVGFDSLISVAKFIGVVALAMLFHSFVVYGGILKLITKLSVTRFFKAYAQVAGVTFSTSSSNAALPVSMETMEDIGVPKAVYSFTLPLGATINMDGTAIMQGVAAVFIAQIYGIDLGISQMLTIVLTAVLASVGTAGVPGVGMITLAMVLQSVSLPIEGIALIIGFDRILDMMRTTVNVMGDCVCSVVVAKLERVLDIEKYNHIGEKK